MMNLSETDKFHFAASSTCYEERVDIANVMCDMLATGVKLEVSCCKFDRIRNTMDSLQVIRRSLTNMTYVNFVTDLQINNMHYSMQIMNKLLRKTVAMV